MITPHRRDVLPGWVVREASHAIPETVYADNKETDMKEGASTSFSINIKPIATVGQTGPSNANMALHFITRKRHNLDHK